MPWKRMSSNVSFIKKHIFFNSSRVSLESPIEFYTDSTLQPIILLLKEKFQNFVLMSFFVVVVLLGFFIIHAFTGLSTRFIMNGQLQLVLLQSTHILLSTLYQILAQSSSVRWSWVHTLLRPGCGFVWHLWRQSTPTVATICLLCRHLKLMISTISSMLPLI